jgi:selenocysteine lyase/cysteine desulfurase
MAPHDRYHTAVVAPLTPDRARLAAIREALPAVSAGIYLNAAAAGPLPAETARVMAEAAGREATLGRAHPADAEETLERVGEARAAVAAVLAADLEAVGLTHGTGHGLDLAVAGIPWRPADRAIFLTDRSGGPPWPAELLRGIGVDVVDIAAESLDESAILLAVEAAAARGARGSAGARLVGLPHVLETTGEVLPVARVAEVAHAAGAVVAVDGTQSVGAFRVAPAELGADVLAFPADRWLLGPAGLGGLWCGSSSLSDRMVAIHPAGYADPLGRGRGKPERAAHATPTPWHRPSVVGMARSCGWLSMQVGLGWAWARAGELARRAGAALRAIHGVTVLATPDRTATVLSFRIDGWSAAAAAEELGARIFAITGLVSPLDAIRISAGAWNTEEEIDRFAAAISLLAAHTPDALPPRRTLNVVP